MKKEEAKKIIRETFTEKFDEKKFKDFISNLFNGYEETNKIFDNQYVKDKFKKQVLKYKELGVFSDSEDNKIGILLVALNNENTLQKSRTLQRNFVADYLQTKGKEAALVAFITDGKADD
jgi:hypothetical protein